MKVMPYSRRAFLKTLGVSGGGLIVGLSLSGCDNVKPALKVTSGSFTPNAFIQIKPNNQICFYCPRDEIGQGVTTGLATLVAEELDVEPSAIDVRLAGVHADYNNPAVGFQITGGSTSTYAHFIPLRQAAANARLMLLQIAADELGVSPDKLKTDQGQVIYGDKVLNYGQFADRASQIVLDAEAPLKPQSEFKYIGKVFPRLDGVEKATGTAKYGIDTQIPGQHYVLVKRAPVYGGTVSNYDSIAAAAMPGVTDVVAISTGVAVVAKKFWQAKQALEKLQIEWEEPELANYSSDQIKQAYASALEEETGELSKDSQAGDFNEAIKSAETVVEAEYWAPYLAHATMEPMSAAMRVEDGVADVWLGSQAPAVAQGMVAKIVDLPTEKVNIHSLYSGGGFGRRTVLTHVGELAEVFSQVRKPIKILFTREHDMHGGYYRPASLIKISAGLDKQGNVSAWQAKRAGGNIAPYTVELFAASLAPSFVPQSVISWGTNVAHKAYSDWTIDNEVVAGLYEDYNFPNRELRHVTVDHGMPLAYWRAVSHSYTAFAKESMIDELADKAGKDPVKFRLQLMAENPRLKNTLEVAAERTSQLSLSPGHFLGVACHGSFGTYISEIAETSVTDQQITVHRVICVVDCGQVVNPDIVKAQMEGGIIFGLTAALYGDIELENGVVKQSNFHDYKMTRMLETPEIEVIIIDSNEPPTGVGEPGLPPIAPAVANAIYQATGQRLRSLPLKVT